MTTPPVCHSSHLFAHPLCKTQSLLKRIANVVFHILTLGIPLAIYSIYSILYRSPQLPSKYVFVGLNTNDLQDMLPGMELKDPTLLAGRVSLDRYRSDYKNNQIIYVVMNFVSVRFDQQFFSFYNSSFEQFGLPFVAVTIWESDHMGTTPLYSLPTNLHSYIVEASRKSGTGTTKQFANPKEVLQQIQQTYQRIKQDHPEIFT